jgi:hypothetical protein
VNDLGRWKSHAALFSAVLSLLLGSGGAMAAPHCFRVYDADGKLTYEGRQAPVDLRNTDSESWTKLRGRSEHLQWHAGERCQGDGQEAMRSTSGRAADAKGNAALILNRVQPFAGR